MPEVLPDPTQAAEAGRASPRDRTIEHLRKVMAAAAGLALGGSAALADVTPPPGNDGKAKQGDPNKTGDGKAKEGGDKKGKQAQQKKPEQPPPSYGVVDPMPEPYIDRKGKPGFLRVSSTPPGATILLDGNDSGLVTPQSSIKLQPGVHAITLNIPKRKISETFTVEIVSGQTVTEQHDLRPPAPKPTPAK
jgi:hypothetical protein